MSERDEFEAWAGRNFLDVTRNRGMVIDYVKPDTQLAWLAWQAARAPQAVPALTGPIYQWRGNSIDNWTDCAKETYDNIGLTLERYPADQPKPTWERRIVYAAPQPSPRPAVPALTDEEIQTMWNDACKDGPGRPGWSRHIRFARAILAAPQPSPEPKGPEHAHDWRFSLQDHVYKCDCGATRGDYPFGAASFKD